MRTVITTLMLAALATLGLTAATTGPPMSPPVEVESPTFGGAPELAPDEPVVVTPVAPWATPAGCSDDGPVPAALWLDPGPGAVWTVDGQAWPAGSVVDVTGEQVEVAAEAAPGYVFDDLAEREWTIDVPGLGDDCAPAPEPTTASLETAPPVSDGSDELESAIAEVSQHRPELARTGVGLTWVGVVAVVLLGLGTVVLGLTARARRRA